LFIKVSRYIVVYTLHTTRKEIAFKGPASPVCLHGTNERSREKDRAVALKSNHSDVHVTVASLTLFHSVDIFDVLCYAAKHPLTTGILRITYVLTIVPLCQLM